MMWFKYWIKMMKIRPKIDKMKESGRFTLIFFEQILLID